MIDFAAARRMMVDGQVRTSDVTDLRIIAAMLMPRQAGAAAKLNNIHAFHAFHHELGSEER